MFCKNCGNKLEDDWVKCPFCEEPIVEINSNEQVGIKENLPINIEKISGVGKPKKKKGKRKKILIGVVVAFVLLIIFMMLGSDEDDSSSKSETSIVKTMEEVGGYEQWVADEYPGKVRTDIVVDLPISERDSNDYCVHILTSLGDPIYIMQEDETNVSEWEWLQNAVADMEDGNTAAFQATLTLCGYVAMDSGQVIPKFIAEDIEPYTVRTIEVVNEPEDNSAEFIFPTSDRAYLAEEEIRSKTTEEMFIGRNEIFARHGYIFESDVLKAHFGNTSWYEGTILGSNFNADAVFNEFEQYNVALIKQIEDEINGPSKEELAQQAAIDGAYNAVAGKKLHLMDTQRFIEFGTDGQLVYNISSFGYASCAYTFIARYENYKDDKYDYIVYLEIADSEYYFLDFGNGRIELTTMYGSGEFAGLYELM